MGKVVSPAGVTKPRIPVDVGYLSLGHRRSGHRRFGHAGWQGGWARRGSCATHTTRLPKVDRRTGILFAGRGIVSAESRAHVRNRTGSSRLRGGCSTNRASRAVARGARTRCAGASGDAAPAEGIEPSKGPVNSRVPDHQASLECENVMLDGHAGAAADPSCPSSMGGGTTKRSARACASSFLGARLSEIEVARERHGSGHRVRTCLPGFRDQCPAS